MLSSILRFLTALLMLLPTTAMAAPVKLKLSFFSSDRSIAYQMAVKPFVDAVNREGKEMVEINVYFSGALGRVQRELPQQVRSGVADIAFIVPGQNPDVFTHNVVVELPGLFHDVREATLTYTRLVAAGALSGYQDFFVIGAYGTAPEIITSRKPLKSLADLEGQESGSTMRRKAGRSPSSARHPSRSPSMKLRRPSPPEPSTAPRWRSSTLRCRLRQPHHKPLSAWHQPRPARAGDEPKGLRRSAGGSQEPDREIQRRVDGAKIYPGVRGVRQSGE